MQNKKQTKDRNMRSNYKSNKLRNILKYWHLSLPVVVITSVSFLFINVDCSPETPDGSSRKTGLKNGYSDSYFTLKEGVNIGFTFDYEDSDAVNIEK